MSRIRLLRQALFASLILVAGMSISNPSLAAPLTNLDGECQQAEVDLNLCAVYPETDVVIEAITGNNGEFPRIIDGRSWFSYQVTDDGKGPQPSHFNLELLLCPGNPDLVSLYNGELSGPNEEIKDSDPSTGLSYPGSKLVKFDVGVPKKSSQQYNLVFDSESIGVDLVNTAIKAGSILDETMILGPGCGQPDVEVSKTCTLQRVKDDKEGATIESFFTTTVTNTGNLALYDAEIQEQNTNLDCEIVSVAGMDVNPPLSIPTDSTVTIPTAGTYAGMLAAADNEGNNGGSVSIGIRCEASAPNLVNNILAKAATSTQFKVSDTDSSDMGIDCPIIFSPDLALEKKCDSVNPGERLAELNGMLVVEICPEIIVRNDGNERLDNVTITDAKISALSSGLDIGSLMPGDSVKLSEYLAPNDLCYLPSAPNEAAIAVDDAGESGNKYDASSATFTNTAQAKATGLFSGKQSTAMDSATCSLSDCPNPTPDTN